MLGALLLTSLTVAALAIARWSSFTVGRIFLWVLGILLAGGIGAAPGTFLGLSATVFHATGTGQLPFYLAGDMPLVICLAGSAVGAVTALLVFDRLSGRRTRRVVVGMAGLLAFTIGIVAAYLAILLGQQTPYEVATLVLIPVWVAAEIVAVYRLVACRRSTNPAIEP
jgi:hypothetical protein